MVEPNLHMYLQNHLIFHFEPFSEPNYVIVNLKKDGQTAGEFFHKARVSE